MNRLTPDLAIIRGGAYRFLGVGVGVEGSMQPPNQLVAEGAA